jgi:hypothetical protein
MAQCCERPRFHHYQHSRTVLDSIMYVIGTDVDMFDGPPTVKQQTYAQLGMNKIVTLEFAYLSLICTVDIYVLVRAGLSEHTLFCCHL